MAHIKQNDPRLYEDIQKIGCFFRSCGIIAEIKCQKDLTAEEINTAWDWAKSKGYIDEENNIRESAPIITHFLRILCDTNGRFVEVGTISDGVTKFYPSISFKYPELCKIDALIQKIKQPGPSKTHFRVVSREGILIEDPHEPIISVTKIEYSILYCYTWN